MASAVASSGSGAPPPPAPAGSFGAVEAPTRSPPFDPAGLSGLRGAAAIAWADARWPRAGTGTCRVAFVLDRERVLKIAFNLRGMRQNATEVERGIVPDVALARVFESDPAGLWIVQERAWPVTVETFRAVAGCSLLEFRRFMYRVYPYVRAERQRYSAASRARELPDLDAPAIARVLHSRVYRDARRLERERGLVMAEFCKLKNLGVLKRNGSPYLVLVDVGLAERYYAPEGKQPSEEEP